MVGCGGSNAVIGLRRPARLNPGYEPRDCFTRSFAGHETESIIDPQLLGNEVGVTFVVLLMSPSI
jgi:hypothetical protein